MKDILNSKIFSQILSFPSSSHTSSRSVTRHFQVIVTNHPLHRLELLQCFFFRKAAAEKCRRGWCSCSVFFQFQLASQRDRDNDLIYKFAHFHPLFSVTFGAKRFSGFIFWPSLRKTLLKKYSQELWLNFVPILSRFWTFLQFQILKIINIFGKQNFFSERFFSKSIILHLFSTSVAWWNIGD